MMSQFIISSQPPPNAMHADVDVAEPSRRSELKAFLFLTVVMVPVLAVAVIGSYGLAVWIYQVFMGPPTG